MSKTITAADILAAPMPAKGCIPNSPDLPSSEGVEACEQVDYSPDSSDRKSLGTTFFPKTQSYTPYEANKLTHSIGSYCYNPALAAKYRSAGTTATAALHHLQGLQQYYNAVFITNETPDILGVTPKSLNKSLNALLKVGLISKTLLTNQIKSDYHDLYSKPLPPHSRIFTLTIDMGLRGQPRLVEEVPSGYYVLGRSAKYFTFLLRHGNRTVSEGLKELQTESKCKYVLDKLILLYKKWQETNS